MELNGERKDVAREDLVDYLKDGWIFSKRMVYVQNDSLEAKLLVQPSTARNLILHHDGWYYGGKGKNVRRAVKEMRAAGLLDDKPAPKSSPVSLEVPEDAWWLQK